MLGACSLDQNSLFQLFPIWTSQDESVLRDLNKCICFVFFFFVPMEKYVWEMLSETDFFTEGLYINVH